ncbi:MAG: exonuclease SbcCD subunit D [Clostridia bacterium]
MKLFHLSDLHLGKRVNGFSMLEDQKYILDQVLALADAERPQAVLIAGDLYDKPVPPAEAVALLDAFLSELSGRGIKVLAVSGNHDSAERIAFGSGLMQGSGVYFSPVYSGQVTPVTLTDRFGPVHFYLLPFVKPAHVRACFPEETIDGYTGAMRSAIAHLAMDLAERNILVTHQFVAGALTCDSEELTVGGTDQVDVSVFEPFDYTALGHLHGPQNVGSDRVRYCGTPLKYSFSEVRHQKSVTVVQLEEKGDLNVRVLPLVPQREMAELRGTYAQLVERSFYQDLNTQCYFHITLTDEEDVPEAINRLRVIYPNIMKLDYDNTRTRREISLLPMEAVETQSPADLFASFYRQKNGRELSEEQRGYLAELIETIWEGAV